MAHENKICGLCGGEITASHEVIEEPDGIIKHAISIHCFIVLKDRQVAISDALTSIARERDALHTEITALREALRALLIVTDRGAQPRKLDEALTWRENDNKARAMALVALGEVDAKRKEVP